MNNRAVIYVRVSSKEQEQEGFSIPAQKKLLTEHAEKRGFVVLKTFEEAETAKQAGRKAFGAMLAFLDANPDIRHVLAEKTDRIYRNFDDAGKLKSRNITIHLVKEGESINKESRSHQKFVHGFKVLVAENYSDNLSEEASKGMTEKASQGLWPSCAPHGYVNRREDKTIYPDPQLAPLIKRAFELAATGQYTLLRLSKQLYDHGLRSKLAKNRLGKQALAHMLRNPIYCGDFFWKGILYRGRHSPIVDRSLFERTQFAMGFIHKPKLTKHDFAFTGIMNCWHCGCAITAEKKTKKSGRTYVYYHCTNGKGVCENVTYLNEDKVEAIFAAALSKISLPSDIVDWTRTALLGASEQEREFRDAEVANLNARYKKLNGYISKCYEDKLEGTIEPEEWKRQNDKWKQEQLDIEGRLSALRSSHTAFADEGIRLMDLASRAADLFAKMPNRDKREVLSLVLSNPQVKAGEVLYEYRMPFSMFTNVVDLEEWRGGRDSNPRPPA